MKKNFMNTPAARMLGGSVSEPVKTENAAPVPAEEVKAPEVKQEIAAAAAPVIQQEVVAEPVKKEAVETELKQEKQPSVKVLIEMSLMDSYKINNIVNAMKLQKKGKYTKKQFYNEMIAEAIKRYEKELGL